MPININITFSNPAVTATIASIPWMVLIIYFIKYPDKLQIWGAIFLNIFKFLWKGKITMEKRVVKMDIEGRVNDFIREKVVKQVGNFLVKRVKINWAEQNEIHTTKKNFIENDQLIIQLHRSENQDENLVDAILLMISHCIVPNQRNYLSKSQKKAVDLYIASKFFEVEKPKIKSLFDDKFICEFQKNPTISDLIAKFMEIDDFGLFFPILIQELRFLSQKTILEKKLHLIYDEVRGLIDFLLEFVQHRKNNKMAQLNYVGEYCKCYILLVGIPEKMDKEGIAPYSNRIDMSRSNGIETVYIISKPDSNSKDFVSQIVLKIGKDWSLKNEFNISCKKRDVDGHSMVLRNSLVILRRPESSLSLPEKNNIPLYDNQRQHGTLVTKPIEMPFLSPDVENKNVKQ